MDIKYLKMARDILVNYGWDLQQSIRFILEKHDMNEFNKKNKKSYTKNDKINALENTLKYLSMNNQQNMGNFEQSYNI